MIAVILAAGEGRRLGKLTESVPKPLLRIGGRTILEHNVALCKAHGFDRLFINLHHLPEAIRAHIRDGAKWGVSVTYRYEETLLGTSGAVKSFEPQLGSEPFLVLYGDNRVEYDLGAFMRRHVATAADMSIAVFRLGDVRHSGVATLDAEDRIVAFVEKPADKPEGGWVNMGVYAMNPALLRGLPAGFSDFGKDVIPRLVREGRRVLAVRMDRKVGAVDTPELYRQSVGPEGGLP
ncbi:MAG: nucleotidyltransferase family protein [Elusimicrobia bacterium]|nr:nucleotidyltransferase family protein [Elusimicrobiota bacterium]